MVPRLSSIMVLTFCVHSGFSLVSDRSNEQWLTWSLRTDSNIEHNFTGSADAWKKVGHPTADQGKMSKMSREFMLLF